MGRIVINETENKQTVILNDSPAGIEGGYFDAQMNWHEMGGDSNDPIYPMIDGSHTFTGSNYNGINIEVQNRNKVIYSNPNAGRPGFVIINDVYSNSASAGSTNINKTDCAVFPKLKAGDVVNLKVSNVNLVNYDQSTDKGFAVALRYGSNSYCSTGTITADAEATWTVQEETLISVIFAYFGADTQTATFNVEVTVNGRRYL